LSNSWAVLVQQYHHSAYVSINKRGSFAVAGASLREAATPLRVTELSER
jgi:hypothetical protein